MPKLKKVALLLVLTILLVSCNDSILKNSTTSDSVNIYTITFDSDGGSEVPQQKVLEGMTAVEPKVPTKLGYEFLRWTLDNETYDFTTPVTSNIELKAFYTSTKALNYVKNDARKIYDLANLFVNLFVNLNTLTNEYAGDIVIYVNNISTGEAKLYINDSGDPNSITLFNKQIEYVPSQYEMEIKNSSIVGNSLKTSEDGKTKTIKFESLSLEVTYTKKTTSGSTSNTTITSSGSSVTGKVTESATLNNVNIVLTEKTVDGTDYVEGTVEMEIETKGAIKMTFTEMDGALVAANFLGLDLTF